VLVEGGDGGEDLVAGEQLRRAEAVAPGEDVVDLEAEPVEGRLPPLVVGDDELQVAHDVGGVAEEEPALLESVEDEGDVPLLQVAHAAVDELGGPAGRALAEVVLLEEHDGVATRRRVHGDPDAGGAASHNGTGPRPTGPPVRAEATG